MASQSISQFPAKPVQRISQEFWNSEPVYSEPPPSMVTEPPPVVRNPKRGLLAKLLFVTLFLPMVALLAHVVMNHYS
ncbi:MAG TPA: hypothetical protein VI197_29960 [Polyangiaceae bacterium]